MRDWRVFCPPPPWRLSITDCETKVKWLEGKGQGKIKKKGLISLSCPSFGKSGTGLTDLKGGVRGRGMVGPHAVFFPPFFFQVTDIPKSEILFFFFCGIHEIFFFSFSFSLVFLQPT